MDLTYGWLQATKRQPGASGRLHRTVTGEWVWSSEEEGDRSSDEEVRDFLLWLFDVFEVLTFLGIKVLHLIKELIKELIVLNYNDIQNIAKYVTIYSNKYV